MPLPIGGRDARITGALLAAHGDGDLIGDEVDEAIVFGCVWARC